MSDAMAKDVMATISRMQSDSNTDIAALADGWSERLKNEEWVLTEVNVQRPLFSRNLC